VLTIRAHIDQPFSRESSASPNLTGDQAAHPVYDPSALSGAGATLSDAVCSRLTVGHSTVLQFETLSTAHVMMLMSPLPPLPRRSSQVG